MAPQTTQQCVSLNYVRFSHRKCRERPSLRAVICHCVECIFLFVSRRTIKQSGVLLHNISLKRTDFTLHKQSFATLNQSLSSPVQNRTASMDLYDDLDTKQRGNQVDGWSSGIKLLQTQLALKKVNVPQAAKKDLVKRAPVFIYIFHIPLRMYSYFYLAHLWLCVADVGAGNVA